MCTTYLSFPVFLRVFYYLPLSFQTKWCSFDLWAKHDSGSGFILLRKMENGNLHFHQWALISTYLLLWMVFLEPLLTSSIFALWFVTNYKFNLMLFFICIGIQYNLPSTGLSLYCFYDWTSKTKSFILPLTILSTNSKLLLDNVLVRQYNLLPEYSFRVF